MCLLCEPFDAVRLSKLRELKTCIVNNDFDLLDILTNLKAIVIDPDYGFIPVNSNNKRKRNLVVPTILLKNKYQILSDKKNDRNNIEIVNPSEGDLGNGSAITSLSPPKKIKLDPFYIEIKGKWNDLAGKIKELN